MLQIAGRRSRAAEDQPCCLTEVTIPSAGDNPEVQCSSELSIYDAMILCTDHSVSYLALQ